MIIFQSNQWCMKWDATKLPEGVVLLANEAIDGWPKQERYP